MSHWLECSITQSRLGYIDSIIESNIDGTDSNFRELNLHTIRKGGKKLRPSLYFLSLSTGNYYDKEFLYPAAALELIHIASLYHDDVMDHAEFRRNSVSINAKWGNVNTVYCGNYLFSKAISILSQYGKGINETTCHYVSELCLGQLKESENAYNPHIPYEDHLDIIKKKTASLFKLPCIIGATISRAEDNIIEALTTYSENIGIAFQFIDDLLDLRGDSSKTGKKLGTDLNEGIYTYATLYALKNDRYHQALSDILLMEHLTDSDVREAIEIIRESGGLEEANERAEDYIQKGIEALSILPESNAKQSLLNLASFIISRDH